VIIPHDKIEIGKSHIQLKKLPGRLTIQMPFILEFRSIINKYLKKKGFVTMQYALYFMTGIHRQYSDVSL